MTDGASPCVVCGETSQRPFLEIKGIPANCSTLWSTAAEALGAPRGDLRLTHCSTCSLVRNAAFDSRLIGYDQLYDNSLNFSAAFRAYEQATAHQLSERWKVGPASQVLEIGCGKGEFLTTLCDLTGASGIGFDPSYVPTGSEPRRIRFVVDVYDERHQSERPDLIVCRHVLEHLDDPKAVLQSLRRALSSQPDAGLYVEVPDATHLFASDDMWDLIYPHCSYFDESALGALLVGTGFDILDTGSSFGGQFLYAHARPAHSMKSPPLAGAAARDLVCGFADRFGERVDTWADRLEEARNEGQRVAIWGAGAKCNTFVNVVPGADAVSKVVDANPRKVGTYLAGSGQRVDSPDSLAGDAPNLVVAMNPVYLPEIERSLAVLAPGARTVPV